MLQPFGPEIWLVDGPVIHGLAGFHFPTRMVVIRLSGGGLFLWSPVALTPQLHDALQPLGPVAHLVAPNPFHHMALADWAAAYPAARVHGAKGLAKKRPDLDFDSQLQDSPDPDWSEDIDQVILPNALASEVVFFHRPSATLLVTDLLQNYPQGWFAGWRGWIARKDLMLGAEPAVPRKFRLGFWPRSGARQKLRQVLDWQVQNVVMAHGTPVVGDGTAYLRRAFDFLL